MLNLDILTIKIQDWAWRRDLHKADPTKQILKIGEEYGELCEAILKNRKKVAAKDAIGDIYVALTTLSMQLDVDIAECIQIAYEEVKDRKGKMIDGVYVKESDL